MSNSELVPCPWRKTTKHVHPYGQREFLCGNCKRIYDGIDDGDVGYSGPERYAERKEEFEARRARRGNQCRR